MLDHALRSSGENADAMQMGRLAERLVQHYEDHIAIKTRLFPGFLEAANQLRDRGARFALCTNKLDRLVTKLLSALRIATLFDAKAGRDTFPFHKPDPRHITELVSRAAGALPFAIMVGDSEADIAAARGAGIPVFAVRFGYATVAPEDLGADAILDSFEELPGLISAFLPVNSSVRRSA
jgi:phosphoglycolate phosphatase